jgi:hypothetical protein
MARTMKRIDGFWIFGVALVGWVLLLVSSGSEAATDPFSGRWAMLQLLTTTSEIPVAGTLRSKTESVVLYDLTYDRDMLSGEGSLCSLRIDSGTNLVKTILPKRFLATLPKPKLSASLISKGGRWSFYQPKQTIVVGASINDVVGDSLPNRASDPRVIDQDKDGKPGVTIQISGIATGDIYVTQRNWTELSGFLKAPGRIEGRALFGSEQHILGATSWYLTRSPHSQPEPRDSSFYLIRLGKKASCRDAMASFGLAN